jgi:hypothetical protein
MSCLPDDWEPGDNIAFADVDWEKVKPIADDYGGFLELIEAVKRSTAETPESRSDAVKIENVSSTFGGDETAQNDTQDETDDAVYAAQEAYVEGEIGIMELESRLEDAIELDHEPTAHPT